MRESDTVGEASGAQEGIGECSEASCVGIRMGGLKSATGEGATSLRAVNSETVTI